MAWIIKYLISVPDDPDKNNMIGWSLESPILCKNRETFYKRSV